MTKKLIVFCLLLTSAGFAKSKHAPLPEGLLNAKTVYIVNQTGMQQISDGAYSEFSKWGRYRVVSDKSSADLVAVFREQQGYVQVNGNGRSRPIVSMTVYVTNSTDGAYQDTPRAWTLTGLAKTCVNDFRKRVEQQ